MNLSQLAQKLLDERMAIAALFTERKQEDGTYNFTAEEVGNLRTRNDDLAKLQKQYDDALALDGMQRDVKGAIDEANRIVRPIIDGLGGPGQVKARSWGEMFAPHAATLKEIASGKRGTISVDMTGAEWKTLLTLADIAPTADRQAIAPSPQFLADVTPLFQPGATSSNVIEYYVESTYTPQALEVDEGTANTDAALDFTLTQDNVREINVWIPASRVSMDDNLGLQSYVVGRLRHMLDSRRSLQLITGDGTAPNISGILDRSIQTQAMGADTPMDAFHKAITKVMVTGDSVPDAIVCHPNDWQPIRLTRTTDGVYILGNPTDVGPRVLWGLPVTVTTSITEGTGLVGAFRSQAQLFLRDGVTFEASTEHAAYFTERKVALLLYQRLALAVYRVYGFCSVTGI